MRTLYEQVADEALRHGVSLDAALRAENMDPRQLARWRSGQSMRQDVAERLLRRIRGAADAA